MIRPLDAQSQVALQRLAAAFGARIEHGCVALAGRSYPALLAVAFTGDVLAAVLLMPGAALRPA